MLKKLLKIFVILLFIAFAGIVAAYVYVVKLNPNIAVEEVKIESTPERIERGKYLAENVARCIDCHSTHDWTKFSGPITPGTEGKGGDLFDRKQGFPGEFYAPNITPHHLKDWSDGELFRAITAGVSKDGRPLFPSMPYINYGKMDKEDIYSIIAYIRTLPSIQNDIPLPKTDFPMSIFIHLIPKQGEFTAKPPVTDQLNYGKYLATMASCSECHTQTKRGLPVEGMEYAGGKYLTLPKGGTIVSPNITPDNQTGIGSWSQEMFIQRFKFFDKTQNPTATDVKEGEFNSTMPWDKYSQMSREDLAAIYVYLKSQKPVSNKVPPNTLKSH